MSSAQRVSAMVEDMDFEFENSSDGSGESVHGLNQENSKNRTVEMSWDTGVTTKTELRSKESSVEDKLVS